MPTTQALLILVASWYAMLSLIAFAAFAFDKSRSRHPGARRMPERTLHAISALGGFPGAILAMWFIRHKNRKPVFVAITLALAALHIASWVAVMYIRSRRQ
jgi:uncharacterized membrane protein YsdA (DUF1294 family)